MPPINLQAARIYINQGFQVFPTRLDKTPLTPRGFYDATVDPRVAERFWSAIPEPGVAIRTGEPSGILVLDIDPRAGGVDSLQHLESIHGKLPETVTCITGGGGHHYYFRHPGGELPGLKGRWPGIDVKSDGGYCIAPPSWHESGKRYQWLRTHILGDTPLADPPDWLLHELRARRRPQPRQNGAVTPSLETSGYPEGHRNDALASLAGSMQRRGMSPAAILAALQQENLERCTPPLTESEVEAIVVSIGRYEPADPVGPGETPAPKVPKPLDFREILDPHVGTIDYLVDQMIPRGHTTLIAAQWKTGKTFLIYRLIIDSIFGSPVFDALAVPRPLKVALFQFEMPAIEDLRRFRRLMIGSGRRPASILPLIEAGLLKDFSRPTYSLAEPEGIRYFHRDAAGSDLVIVDSAVAAMAPANLNDNSEVRAIFNRAFNPLTTAGATVVLLHHERKASTNPQAGPDQPKSAVLGAQTFGAASSRTYSLERLSSLGTGNFRLRLRSLGSWTPEDSDFVFSLEDMEDPELGGDGMAVRLIPTGDVEKGGSEFVLTTATRLHQIVSERQRVYRQDLVEALRAEGASVRTVERAIKEARDRGWIVAEEEQDGRSRKVLFTPGESGF